MGLKLELQGTVFSDGKNKGCIATTKIFIYILGCTGYFQAHLPRVYPCNGAYINYNNHLKQKPLPKKPGKAI
jgi:hypothetical protein